MVRALQNAPLRTIYEQNSHVQSADSHKTNNTDTTIRALLSKWATPAYHSKEKVWRWFQNRTVRSLCSNSQANSVKRILQHMRGDAMVGLRVK
jgi:tRNA C32,U32 (ribose-2'-O)-methylase TrmJ